MHLLITRPRNDAEALAAELAEHGITSAIEPLLEIRNLDAAVDFKGVQAILITSANGARALAAASPERNLPVFAVGDGSAQTARDLGYGQVESAGGDVDDLAALVGRSLKPEGGTLLHAAGSALAGDLGGAMVDIGFDYRRVVLYEAVKSDGLSEACRSTIAADGFDGVLLYSPRTARSFADLVAKAGLVDRCAAMTAYCLSGAVHQAASDLPWGRMAVAETPDQAALLSLLMDDKRKLDDRNDADEAQMSDTSEEQADMTGETIDAEWSEAEPQPALPKRRGPAIAILVAAALSLVALGAVLWPLALPDLLPPPATDPALPERLAAIESRLAGTAEQTALAEQTARVDEIAARPLPDAGLGDRLAAAEQQLAALTGRLDATGKQAEDGVAGLAARLDVVEAQPIGDLAARLEQLEAGDPALGDRLAAVEARLAELGALAPAATDSAAPAPDPAARAERQALAKDLNAARAGFARDLKAARTALEASLAATEQRLDEIAARLADLESRPAVVADGGSGSPALVLAVDQIGRALDDGTPSAALLDSLAPAVADQAAAQAALEKLRAATAQPLASRTTLASDLTVAARQAVHAERALPEEGWVNQTINRLTSLVSIRRTGTAPGETADARLARAEHAMAGGDLRTAVTEVAALTGPAAEAMAAWRQAAEARLAAEDALAELRAVAIGDLKGGAGAD